MTTSNTTRLAAIGALALGIAVAPAAGHAQDGPPSRWSLGLGQVATDSAYAGEDVRYTPFPLVSYEGERFFFRGVTAGWRFVRTERFTLAGIARVRLDGFDIDDLGRDELARNGLDAALLEDRDDSLDTGLRAQWRGAAGELELEVLADVTDAGGGFQVELGYEYPYRIGEVRVVPGAGVRWLSDDTANYYYGTLPEEVARGSLRYEPDAVAIPSVGIDFARPFGRSWVGLASFSYRSLPGEIERSPLIERDRNGETSVLLGVSRSF